MSLYIRCFRYYIRRNTCCLYLLVNRLSCLFQIDTLMLPKHIVKREQTAHNEANTFEILPEKHTFVCKFPLPLHLTCQNNNTIDIPMQATQIPFVVSIERSLPGSLSGCKRQYRYICTPTTFSLAQYDRSISYGKFESKSVDRNSSKQDYFASHIILLLFRFFDFSISDFSKSNVDKINDHVWRQNCAPKSSCIGRS